MIFCKAFTYGLTDKTAWIFFYLSKNCEKFNWINEGLALCNYYSCKKNIIFCTIWTWHTKIVTSVQKKVCLTVKKRDVPFWRSSSQLCSPQLQMLRLRRECINFSPSCLWRIPSYEWEAVKLWVQMQNVFHNHWTHRPMMNKSENQQHKY